MERLKLKLDHEDIASALCPLCLFEYEPNQYKIASNNNNNNNNNQSFKSYRDTVFCIFNVTNKYVFHTGQLGNENMNDRFSRIHLTSNNHNWKYKADWMINQPKKENKTKKHKNHYYYLQMRKTKQKNTKKRKKKKYNFHRW